MIKIFSASADTYITNRVINRNLRAKDANLGAAGTIDLFKLYNESIFTGESEPIEVSRALIKFDLNPLRALTGSLLDTNSSNFKCKLKMKDVYGGQPTPTNFRLILHPLSRSFDEGRGRDVIRFDDIESANFLTASYRNGSLLLWAAEGASAEGACGQAGIDIIASADFGGGQVPVTVVQDFTGDEDLVMDVTQIVSGTLAGIIPDCGFRIAYSGSQETDAVTRFVKRFTTRHSSSPSKRPRLEVTFDDAVIDNHSNMVFNHTGSLFLNNYVRSVPANFVSGSAASQVSGPNCMILTIKSGSYSKILTASQAQVGGVSRVGLYSASFAISSFEAPLFTYLKSTPSASFSEVWGSLDGTVAYYSGSFTVNLARSSAIKPQTRSLYARITNCRSEFHRTDRIRFILFIEDQDEEVVFTRFPRENNGHVYDNVHYGIVDAVTGESVISIAPETNGTRVSSSADGMWFDFHFDALTPGRTYKFNVMVRDLGEDLILHDVSPAFRVIE
jgi:hypothetical protein